jgi:hypothetical protein
MPVILIIVCLSTATVPASAFRCQRHPSPGEGNKQGSSGASGASSAASTIGQRNVTKAIRLDDTLAKATWKGKFILQVVVIIPIPIAILILLFVNCKFQQFSSLLLPPFDLFSKKNHDPGLLLICLNGAP